MTTANKYRWFDIVLLLSKELQKVNCSANLNGINSYIYIFLILATYNNITYTASYGLNLAVLVDVSKSIDDSGRKPENWNHVITFVRDFLNTTLDNFGGRIALISFAKWPTTYSNLTDDEEYLLEKVAEVDHEGTSFGTNIAGALLAALELFDGKDNTTDGDTYDIVLLISDGEPFTNTRGEHGRNQSLKMMIIEEALDICNQVKSKNIIIAAVAIVGNAIPDFFKQCVTSEDFLVVAYNFSNIEEGKDMIFKFLEPLPAFECGSPPAVNNGQFVTADNTNLSLVLVCDAGFKADENTTVTCTENGWYQNGTGLCAAIVCGSPPVVKNGQFVVADNTNISLILICDAGFVADENTTVTCTENGWYQNGTGLCVEYDDICLLSPCLNGGTCLLNGLNDYTCSCINTYTGTNCQAVVCGSPPVVKNGQFVAADNTNISFFLICDSGFKADEHTAVTCTDYGWYQNGTGLCLEAMFDDPCLSSPCLNGGICEKAGPNHYSCSCIDQYVGTHCQDYAGQDNETSSYSTIISKGGIPGWVTAIIVTGGVVAVAVAVMATMGCPGIQQSRLNVDALRMTYAQPAEAAATGLTSVAELGVAAAFRDDASNLTDSSKWSGQSALSFVSGTSALSSASGASFLSSVSGASLLSAATETSYLSTKSDASALSDATEASVLSTASEQTGGSGNSVLSTAFEASVASALLSSRQSGSSNDLKGVVPLGIAGASNALKEVAPLGMASGANDSKGVAPLGMACGANALKELAPLGMASGANNSKGVVPSGIVNGSNKRKEIIPLGRRSTSPRRK